MIIFSASHFEPDSLVFPIYQGQLSAPHGLLLLSIWARKKEKDAVLSFLLGLKAVREARVLLPPSLPGQSCRLTKLSHHSAGFVPICSLGLSQIGRMNLGMDASTFKFYTMCGLQEGFEPFAVNMNRDVAMWFSKRLPTFVNVPKDHPQIEVCYTYTSWGTLAGQGDPGTELPLMLLSQLVLAQVHALAVPSHLFARLQSCHYRHLSCGS